MLLKAAEDHLNDIGPKGLTSHVSSDKKRSYKHRIEKYALWGGCIYEAILYGYHRPQAKHVVLDWLIDDGFLKRQNRLSLMTDELKEFACVAGSHKTA